MYYHQMGKINVIKGNAYEEQICNELKKTYSDVWLWKDVPQRILIEQKIIYPKFNKNDSIDAVIGIEGKRIDIGVDIIGCKDGVYYYIQCKNYEKNIVIDDLAGFLMFLAMNSVGGILCYTNGVSKNVVNWIDAYKLKSNSNKISLMKIPYVDNAVGTKNNKNSIETDFEIKLYDYQVEAIEKLKEGKHRLLSIPCGLGKTVIASFIGKKYDNIIVFAPLRELVIDLRLNIEKYLFYTHTSIIVSRDGLRKADEIEKMLKAKNLIVSTYCSSNLILELMNNTGMNKNNTIIIIDESHNLSNANLTDAENNMHKILNYGVDILYLSATPNRNIKYDAEYYYEWNDAILNKYICDFNISVPSGEVLQDNGLDNIANILCNADDKFEKDKSIIKKIYFILQSLKYNGNKKCIVYVPTIEKSQLYEKILKGFSEILDLDLFVNVVTQNITGLNRKIIIGNFKETDKMAILINVHILDEGINIPECDSVFITQPSDNIENIIQRLCRCNRMTEHKKKCNMYMWCEKHELVKIFNYIKHNTNDYIDKICYFDPFSNETNMMGLVKKDLNAKINDGIVDGNVDNMDVDDVDDMDVNDADDTDADSNDTDADSDDTDSDSDDTDVDNIDFDNIDVDNINVDNIDADNINVDNIDVDNIDVDNIDVDNTVVDDVDNINVGNVRDDVYDANIDEQTLIEQKLIEQKLIEQKLTKRKLTKRNIAKQKVSKNDKFTCKKCDQTFTTHANLVYHQTHKSCKNVQMYCEYCNKGFTSKSSLMRHIRTACKLYTQHEEEKKLIYDKLVAQKKDFEKKIADFMNEKKISDLKKDKKISKLEKDKKISKLEKENKKLKKKLINSIKKVKKSK
jgi:superfamily II DNA or RNA helicase